ncbi:MAG: hypothetical protein AAGA60_30270 [Cyanobacteria bacterium P01_E01_bin.42]
MNPITYYCDNSSTQSLSEKWGSRLEKMPTPAKEFLVSLIGNALFLNCSVVDIAESVMGTPKICFVSGYGTEVSLLRQLSNYDMAKILEFFSTAIAEDYRRKELENLN